MLSHGQGSGTRPLCLVGLFDRRSEEGDQFVAYIAHECAVMCEQLFGHPVVVLAEKLDHLLRGMPLREGGETGQVTE